MQQSLLNLKRLTVKSSLTLTYIQPDTPIVNAWRTNRQLPFLLFRKLAGKHFLPGLRRVSLRPEHPLASANIVYLFETLVWSINGLGLSASVLAGRTARSPQLLPGPGQPKLKTET